MEKCVKLVISKNYNEMHGQQNIKFYLHLFLQSVLLPSDFAVKTLHTYFICPDAFCVHTNHTSSRTK
jgi:hypothetical protein